MSHRVALIVSVVSKTNMVRLYMDTVTRSILPWYVFYTFFSIMHKGSLFCFIFHGSFHEQMAYAIIGDKKRNNIS